MIFDLETFQYILLGSYWLFKIKIEGFKVVLVNSIKLIALIVDLNMALHTYIWNITSQL